MSKIYIQYYQHLKKAGKLSEIATSVGCTVRTLEDTRSNPNRLGRGLAERIFRQMKKTNFIDQSMKLGDVFPKWSKCSSPPEPYIDPYTKHIIEEVRAGRTTYLIVQEVYDRAGPLMREKLGPALRELKASPL